MKLNRIESEIYNELTSKTFHGITLMEFVKKSLFERNLSTKQLSYALYSLHCDGKVDISEDLLIYDRFDKMLCIYINELHAKRNASTPA